MPKVSVIVPNYNHEKYLEKRLESIFAQTYGDLEIILLDDCSTDNSLVVINKYRNHPKISQIIVNKNNSGSPFLQWNKGIQLSKGEFIWIAESDDYSGFSFLQTHIDVLESDLSIGLSHCQSWLVDEDDNILLSCSDWLGARWKKNFKNIGIKEFEEFGLYSHGIVNASAVVFRKSAVDKISPSFLNYKFLGDEVFWNEIMWYSNVAYESNHLNYFRTHPSNTSKKLTKEGIRILEGYQLLGYYNKKFNCSHLPAFKKKLKHTNSLWRKSILRFQLSLQMNLKILGAAIKTDRLIVFKMLFNL